MNTGTDFYFFSISLFPLLLPSPFHVPSLSPSGLPQIYGFRENCQFPKQGVRGEARPKTHSRVCFQPKKANKELLNYCWG